MSMAEAYPFNLMSREELEEISRINGALDAGTATPEDLARLSTLAKVMRDRIRGDRK
jgi:hypothetical protein